MTGLQNDPDLHKSTTVDIAEKAVLAKGGTAAAQVKVALEVLKQAIKAYVGEDNIAYEQRGAEEAAQAILQGGGGNVTRDKIKKAYDAALSRAKPG